jgi:1-acyl-sn-glycerol-3-phosphate acyltransferase
MVMVQNHFGQRLSLEGPGGFLMAYKHGRPVIDDSFAFRIATAWTFYVVFALAKIVNFMQYYTRYKHRWRLYGHKKAITVSNHTTFFDPVKIAGLPWPRLIFQTMLEATVEFPVVGTLTRLLGGVPIPRGRTGFKKILDSCDTAFKYRRYLHFYPEGECFVYNQQIKEFKPGAFLVAAELDIPVIPMVTVFSEGPFRPFSFLGRSLPLETLVVLPALYPADYIRRDEKGEISSESVKEFAQTVRQIMQNEIDRRHGTNAFFKGQMERIKGLND